VKTITKTNKISLPLHSGSLEGASHFCAGCLGGLSISGIGASKIEVIDITAIFTKPKNEEEH
jgi:hypothetical protein